MDENFDPRKDAPLGGDDFKIIKIRYYQGPGWIYQEFGNGTGERTGNIYKYADETTLKVQKNGRWLGIFIIPAINVQTFLNSDFLVKFLSKKYGLGRYILTKRSYGEAGMGIEVVKVIIIPSQIEEL